MSDDLKPRKEQFHEYLHSPFNKWFKFLADIPAPDVGKFPGDDDENHASHMTNSIVCLVVCLMLLWIIYSRK